MHFTQNYSIHHTLFLQPGPQLIVTFLYLVPFTIGWNNEGTNNKPPGTIPSVKGPPQ